MSLDLDTAAAKLEIAELEARYAWAIDEGRVEQLAEIFADDARLILTPGDVDQRGRADVLAWFRAYCGEWGWHNRRHYVTNLQSRVDGDVALCRAYFLLTYEVHGRSRIGWGNYEDRFERRDGRWWMTEKRITSAGPVSLDKGWAGLTLPPRGGDWP